MRFATWKVLRPALLALLALLTFPPLAQAQSAFVAIFIDTKSEARLGTFPYDRAVYANALLAFQKLGASGVVLKFFIDQPKGKGDDALALAMTTLPVILQARCDDAEPNPNPLAQRFSTVASKDAIFAMTCTSGWIPLARLQEKAANVCFIDQSGVDTPFLLERYQGRAVKSLYVCALELAGKPIPVAEANGSRKVDLSAAPRAEVISLVDVLDGKIDRARIANKIVVFGYEGPQAPMFDSAIGRISAHRAFMANLLALEQKRATK